MSLSFFAEERRRRHPTYSFTAAKSNLSGGKPCPD